MINKLNTITEQDYITMIDMFEWPLFAQRLRRIFYSSILFLVVLLVLSACNMTYWSTADKKLWLGTVTDSEMY